MTDPDKIRLCAEALGLGAALRRTTDPAAKHPESAFRAYLGKKAPFWYDPLHDDAQCMALVKKFGLELKKVMETWHVWNGDEGAVLSKDLNAAVVDCVAKMQAEKAVR